MFDIPTIEDYYRGSADQFRRTLAQRSVRELAAVKAEDLVQEYLNEYGLPYVEIEVKSGGKPVFRKTRDGNFISIDVRPEKAATLRLMEQQRLRSNPFSCSFNPSRLSVDHREGILSYPCGDSSKDAQATHTELTDYIANINANIREQTPRFLATAKEIAQTAISRAESELKRQQVLEQETGFDVIDET